MPKRSFIQLVAGPVVGLGALVAGAAGGGDLNGLFGTASAAAMSPVVSAPPTTAWTPPPPIDVGTRIAAREARIEAKQARAEARDARLAAKQAREAKALEPGRSAARPVNVVIYGTQRGGTGHAFTPGSGVHAATRAAERAAREAAKASRAGRRAGRRA